MSEKTKTYLIEKDGETEELNETALKAYVQEQTGVKSIKMESDEGEGEVVPAEDIIDGVFQLVESGSELDDSFPDEVGEVYNFVKEVMTNSKKLKEAAKDAAKAEKEARRLAAEKAKEEEERKKAELGERKNKLFKFIKKGADKAAKQFEGAVQSFAKGLPKGITISENSHKGFGIVIEEGVNESDMALATGYLLQQSENSEAMARTSGFLFGDLCNHFVAIDLFPSRIQAAKFISEKALENGKKISQRGIESYARMSDRIALEHRNTDIVDKAYLTLANAKVPKREDGEDKKAYAKRLEEYENDRSEIAEKLANGEVSEVKDISELVNDMQVKHGLKQAKDPAQKSVSDHLRTFFLGTIYLEKLVGVFEEGEIHFQEKGSKDVTFQDAAEVAEMVENARGNLINSLVSYKTKGVEVTLEELENGEAAFDVPKIDTISGKPTGKTVVKMVPVYPRPFFDVPKSEEKKTNGGDDEEE